MMPALGLIAFGSRKRWPVPLPIPVILLWPLILLGLAGVFLVQGILRLSGSSSTLVAAGKTGSMTFCQLRGLKVDVRSSDGTRVLIWFV